MIKMLGRIVENILKLKLIWTTQNSQKRTDNFNLTDRSPLSFNLNCTYVHYKSNYPTELQIKVDSI
jgi:hypothetical protein